MAPFGIIRRIKFDFDFLFSSHSRKKALVALDESDESFYALQWALDFVLRQGDAIVLLHSKDQPPPFMAGAPVLGAPLPAEVFDSFKKHQEAVTNRIMNKAKTICDGRGLEVEFLTALGDARANICSQITKSNADVLIMGSHGYGAVKRVFLGSVSNYCAQNVKCPILETKRTFAEIPSRKFQKTKTRNLETSKGSKERLLRDL